MKRPRVNEIFFQPTLASGYTIFKTHSRLPDRTQTRFFNKMASPTSRTSLSSSFSSALTPRRSPRLAAKRSSNILTPVRNTLRSFAFAKKGVAVGDVFTLEEAEEYASLTAEVATADVGNNTLKNFLIVNRKLKLYDADVSPYDAVKLFVTEDGSYRLLAYDNLLENNVVTTPFKASCIVPTLNKLADCSWAVCPGIKDYSVYKDSIGYNLKRVAVNNCLPDSVRDHECTVMYQQRSTSRSPICGKCTSLKWHLTRRKREHDDLTPSQRAKRQSSSSKVPFDTLSPVSQKARVDSMRKTIKNLQSKTDYYSGKIERLSANEVQNEEIGKLVNAIVSSDNGCQKLDEIYAEANCVKNGLGNQLKEIWKKDCTDWQQFLADQETNGKCTIVTFT